ncbi:MAG: hypothetical protein KJ017_05120 [Alphaproteobacteria bacterium]|nr:hypothetical protein [Alphaproteobacteria bacterium]
MNIHDDKTLYKLITASYAIFLLLLFAVLTAGKGLAAGIFALFLALMVPLFCWASATLYKWMVLEPKYKKPLSNVSGTFVNSCLWTVLFGFLLFISTTFAFMTWEHLSAAFPTAEIKKSPVSVIPTPENFPKPLDKN